MGDLLLHPRAGAVRLHRDTPPRPYRTERDAAASRLVDLRAYSDGFTHGFTAGRKFGAPAPVHKRIYRDALILWEGLNLRVRTGAQLAAVALFVSFMIAAAQVVAGGR